MHTYEVNLKWTGKTKGILSSTILPKEIEMVTPPEYSNGTEGMWTPEHLLIAKINSCLMSTFLTIAENSNLEFISYESKSICTVEIIRGKYFIIEIVLKPKVVIPYSQKPERVKQILEMSKNVCLISNAIKTPIRLDPEIIVSEIQLSF
ncbi:OsmC family protein [Flavobacterium xinjiangense]|jgi:organic hydroperoxide reductase OsmC/OhrA|uniref:Organic hydroperoxide reductase OsmC/OhrA n=1 Tax=Flavobacterium xinjiangense TaxID=178356 RepID=A0A1M7JWU8_9FLAO|nr:OsmC family protein [Flavobacterium xinjiangense]SHM57464.1 Organic hydroperoxide reductase OsmC/OhrA [Flavobacterium xinjiangense]